MKRKWKRIPVFLLAMTIFMTHMSYFLVMGAEISEEVIEVSPKVPLETEPFAAEEAIKEEQSGLVISSLNGRDIVKSYSYDDTSLSGVSFTVTDVRDSSRTKLLDTDDGKPAVYLFGAIVSCGNTKTSLANLSKCTDYYDKDMFNVYAFDFRGGTAAQIASWLDAAGISEDIFVGTAEYGNEAWDLYSKCFLATVANSSEGSVSFAMPLIVYKGIDGEIYAYTTSVQSEDAICKNIEAGGLKKVSNMEGLLYVMSGADYDMAYEILDLVNTERQKEGLTALTMDKDLLDAAMQRAVECEVYFNHTRPNGQTCFSACSKMNGENIAWGYTDAAAVMNGWMNSTGHRENILGSSFQSVGIGISDAGGRLAFVQCFGTGAADAVQKPSSAASKTYEVRYKREYVEPTLTQNSMTLRQGEVYSLAIKAGNIPYYDNGNAIKPDSYTWTSSNDNVASVNSSGNVEGVRSGRAVVTGTNVLNHEDTLTLEVLVEGEGDLWGEVQPEDIPVDGIIPKGIWAAGIKDATYTGKAITHNIHVYDGNKLLTEKTDYTVSYKNNIKAAKKTDAKAPVVIISGKGNYNEKKTIPFNINPKNIQDADVMADDITLAYTGKEKKVAPVILYKKKKLALNKDFIVVNPLKYSEAKEYTIKAEGRGNYTGTRDITLTITEKTPINKASVTKIANQIYDGKAKTPDVKVKLGKELERNKDYTLSYENNSEIGTAFAVIRGQGEYAGVKRVSFQIIKPYKKYDIGEDTQKAVTVSIDREAAYQKGGNMPAVSVSFHGTRLIRGKDYTVSYRNNKAAYAVSGKDAEAVITGKGNYCGKISRTFRIETKDISKTILVANDKVYIGKVKGYVPKITLTDMNGKRLKAGTDYEKAFDYTYVNAVKLDNGENRKAGDAVKDSDIVPVGTTIQVTVKGMGSYSKTITGNYRVIEKENNISKAKVVLKNPQYYTGSAVEPGKDQFEVTLGGKILSASDYSIVCYTNNRRKGNANITIRGEGAYGGTKTAKFVIGSRTIESMEVN